MNYARFVAAAALFCAAPAIAQVLPHAIDGDAHRVTLDYEAGKVVQLRGALGYQMMIELAPDEDVQNVAVGDSSAWEVNVDSARNRIFLKPERAGVQTNMTVVTSVRTYSFDLDAVALPDPVMTYSVAFQYLPPKAPSDESQYVNVSGATRRLTKYRISGDPQLRPESVSDDGRHTYITWPSTAPIPATYSRGPSGEEVLVNGTMGTDDVFVVDGVPLSLTFRLDHSVARAERIFPRRPR